MDCNISQPYIARQDLNQLHAEATATVRGTRIRLVSPSGGKP